MTSADVFLAALAIGAGIFLARDSGPFGAVLIIASALAVAAVLFLPTLTLTEWFGMDRVHRLYDLSRGTGMDPPEWIHLFAFTWLTLLVWLSRKSVRNWRGVALLAALGATAELLQWLTVGRELSVEDGVLNVAGVLVGIGLGMMFCSTEKKILHHYRYDHRRGDQG